MGGLIIGSAERTRIQDLVQFAVNNVIFHEKMIRLANGLEKPIGDDPRFSITLPVGFRVVYSHEMHKGKLVRHISISSKGAAQGKYPAKMAVDMIIQEFGFTKPHDRHLLLEEEVCAVNVLELI